MRLRTRSWLLAALFSVGACTPRAMDFPTTHPANPDAETGRLAGAPAALRPGVAMETPTPPRDQSQPANPAAEHPPGHVMPDGSVMADPETPDPKTPPAAEKPAAPKKPAAKKPKPKASAKPAAPTGHEGHDMTGNNMPAKPAEKPPAKPAPTGHEGHDMPAKQAEKPPTKPPAKPAPTGHEGHDMPAKPAEKPPAKPPAKPTPTGHEGHKMSVPAQPPAAHEGH